MSRMGQKLEIRCKTPIDQINQRSDAGRQMLYASTRGSLLKSLGSTLFTDSIFATSKADLTPEAYAAHRRHLDAPKPLSTREREMADIRAAEATGTYEGSSA